MRGKRGKKKRKKERRHWNRLIQEFLTVQKPTQIFKAKEKKKSDHNYSCQEIHSSLLLGSHSGVASFKRKSKTVAHETETKVAKEKSKKWGVGWTPKMKMAGIKHLDTAFVSGARIDKKERHINFMHKVRGSQWRDVLKKLIFQYASL